MVALIDDGDVHRGPPGELPAGLEPAKARAHDQHFFRHPAAPLLHSAAMGTRFPAEASWLEIDGGALAHNAAIFREVLGAGVRLAASSRETRTATDSPRSFRWRERPATPST